MPILIVINRDDAILPRGWVAAALPDGAEPSSFEREGGVFRVVGVAELPPVGIGQGLILTGDRLEAVADPATTLKKRLSRSLLPVPGPAHLDRSHSTVWDYGPGRTWSSPQAACAALLLQAGLGVPFTETHYLRGFGGTHLPDLVTNRQLHLCYLAPTSRWPLVVDVDPGARVLFDGDGTGRAGVEGDSVEHVRIAGLTMSDLDYGVVPTAVDNNLYEWRVAGCEIAAARVGVLAGCAQIRVSACHIHGCLVGVGDDGVFLSPGYHNPITVDTCLVHDCGRPIAFRGDSPLIIAGNTLAASGACAVHHDTEDYDLVALAVVGNIFTGASPTFTCLRSEIYDPNCCWYGLLDGNVYHPGAEGAVAVIGANTLARLADWQAFSGGEAHSVEADPLLGPDYAPPRGSPARGAGCGLSRAGINGQLRAASIDAGAIQATPARQPAAAPRHAPEIRRKK